MNLQPTLFDSERRTMRDALDLTRQSLLAYGANYDHWAVALLLVPSALFIAHLQRIVDGYRCEVRNGTRWVTAPWWQQTPGGRGRA